MLVGIANKAAQGDHRAVEVIFRWLNPVLHELVEMPDASEMAKARGILDAIEFFQGAGASLSRDVD
jgi:hypothetical protein